MIGCSRHRHSGPVGPRPGSRGRGRPNQRVQLRASPPVCCNVWLGRRAEHAPTSACMGGHEERDARSATGDEGTRSEAEGPAPMLHSAAPPRALHMPLLGTSWRGRRAERSGAARRFTSGARWWPRSGHRSATRSHRSRPAAPWRGWAASSGHTRRSEYRRPPAQARPSSWRCSAHGSVRPASADAGHTFAVALGRRWGAWPASRRREEEASPSRCSWPTPLVPGRARRRE